MRLMAGLLAGAPLHATLTGDEQLLARPMERLAEPLRRMGASMNVGPNGGGPITVTGGSLNGVRYAPPVASAQMKSAILLAGLEASGRTTVVEAVATRDHTERLLRTMGVPLDVAQTKNGTEVSLSRSTPAPLELHVPGDFSSAAALIAAACLVPGSDLRVEDVGLNPTRIGFLRVLERMGADVEVEVRHEEPEPRGTVRIRHGGLVGASVDPLEVPSLIDELPLLGLLGAVAEGVTEVRGAAELRVKESDRIAGLVSGLRALGAEAEELPDGFVVRGPRRLKGGLCDARSDHRLAMTFLVAGLLTEGTVEVVGTSFVADSFPGFLEVLHAG
jgi:3-phosphoshikimate 1-carboxyvinyltransferase